MTASRSELSVALVSSAFFPTIGGTQTVLHNLATELDERGHRPVVVTNFSLWSQFREHRDQVPYRVVPLVPKQHAGLLSGGKWYLRLQLPYFELLQRRYDFDVWHTFGTFPEGVSVGYYADRRDRPHLLRTRGQDVQIDEDLEYGVRRNQEIDSLVRRYATRCDRMIALTESVVEDCASTGIDEARVEVVPCAVDIERFDATTVDPAAVRRRYDLPDEEFLYLTVGRNHPKKGYGTLLEAIDALVDDAPAPFTVAFAGPDQDSLRRHARELGVADSVAFLGEFTPETESGTYQLPPTEIIELYKAADACVLPSLLETFGNVNVEAMAAETPLVTTDAKGSRDIVDHEATGLVATAGDADDLARQMRRLQSSPALRERLAANGRREVERRYTWKTVVETFESLYYELV